MGGHGTRRVNASQRGLVREGDRGGFSRRRSRREDFVREGAKFSWGVMISQSRKFCDDHRRFRRSQADPSQRNTTALLRSLQAADACSPRCYGGPAATDVSYDMPCVVPRSSRSWIFSVCKRVTRSTSSQRQQQRVRCMLCRYTRPSRISGIAYIRLAAGASSDNHDRLFVGWRSHRLRARSSLCCKVTGLLAS